MSQPSIAISYVRCPSNRKLSRLVEIRRQVLPFFAQWWPPASSGDLVWVVGFGELSWARARRSFFFSVLRTRRRGGRGRARGRCGPGLCNWVCWKATSCSLPCPATLPGYLLRSITWCIALPLSWKACEYELSLGMRDAPPLFLLHFEAGKGQQTGMANRSAYCRGGGVCGGVGGKGLSQGVQREGKEAGLGGF